MKMKAFAIGAGICILALSACSRTQTTTNFEDTIEDQPAANNGGAQNDDLNKSKTILYTLPAPVEMASIIKQTGVKFDDRMLSDLGKAGGYATNLKMSLNLGIYASDMSVAGMFNQSQRMVDYLNVLKELTRKLGIVKVLDEDAIRRLEGTNVSREDALDVISEVYMNTNQYLAENNRRNIATVVMAGAWVEGLYLALNLIDNQKLTKDVVERIISQKLALATMINIIESTDPDGVDEDVAYVRTKMNEIKSVFDYVAIDKVGRVSALTDQESHTTTIKANNSSELDPSIVDALKEKVSQIRKEFVE